MSIARLYTFKSSIKNATKKIIIAEQKSIAKRISEAKSTEVIQQLRLEEINLIKLKGFFDRDDALEIKFKKLKPKQAAEDSQRDVQELKLAPTKDQILDLVKTGKLLILCEKIEPIVMQGLSLLPASVKLEEKIKTAKKQKVEDLAPFRDLITKSETLVEKQIQYCVNIGLFDETFAKTHLLAFKNRYIGPQSQIECYEIMLEREDMEILHTQIELLNALTDACYQFSLEHFKENHKISAKEKKDEAVDLSLVEVQVSASGLGSSSAMYRSAAKSPVITRTAETKLVNVVPVGQASNQPKESDDDNCCVAFIKRCFK